MPGLKLPRCLKELSKVTVSPEERKGVPGAGDGSHSGDVAEPNI